MEEATRFVESLYRCPGAGCCSCSAGGIMFAETRPERGGGEPFVSLLSPLYGQDDSLLSALSPAVACTSAFRTGQAIGFAPLRYVRVLHCSDS